MTAYIELRLGDHDHKRKWSGKTWDAISTPPYTVKQLQEQLKSVGVLASINPPDGIFGPNTERALKLFQWVCINMAHCLKNNIAQIKRTRSSVISLNGRLTKETHDELAVWIKNNYQVTGDLIRMDFADLSHIENGPGFKKLSSAKVQTGELVISKAAKNLIIDINSFAKSNGVTIKINQVFRENKVKVSGAVVKPATKSQHLIGHALDCNIVDGADWNNSATFKAGKETAGAKALIKGMKGAGYRWGGDFTPADTPHFDLQLDANKFDYGAKFFLNQRMVSLGQEIKKETPW